MYESLLHDMCTKFVTPALILLVVRTKSRCTCVSWLQFLGSYTYCFLLGYEGQYLTLEKTCQALTMVIATLIVTWRVHLNTLWTLHPLLGLLMISIYEIFVSLVLFVINITLQNILLNDKPAS